MNLYRCIFILFILFSFLPSVDGQGLPGLASTESLKKPEYFIPFLVSRQTDRARHSQMLRLLDLLKIKNGMTILDLGAGTGQYAYEFAERLKGTGRVFASDVDINMVNYMMQEAKKRALTNFFPVLVKEDGLDEFYKNNKFDLIFVAHTYPFIKDRIEYFRELKNQLVKNGRLVILIEGRFKEFSLNDISDFSGLVKALLSEKPDGLFYSRLQGPTQELLRQPSNNKNIELLKRFIIKDFNRIISDLTFKDSFLKNDSVFKEKLSLTMNERKYIDYVFQVLTHLNSICTKAESSICDSNVYIQRSIKKLNAILLVQKFRRYFYDGRPGSYLFRRDGYFEDSYVTRELLSAGYKLEHKYDFIMFEMILIFKPI